MIHIPQIGDRYIWHDGNGILEIVGNRRMKVVVAWNRYKPVGSIDSWWPLDDDRTLIFMEGQQAPR